MTTAKKTYNVTGRISVPNEDGVTQDEKLPGSTVELTDEQAEYLLSKGSIELPPAAAKPALSAVVKKD